MVAARPVLWKGEWQCPENNESCGSQVISQLRKEVHSNLNHKLRNNYPAGMKKGTSTPSDILEQQPGAVIYHSIPRRVESATLFEALKLR
jgi:hypothetical protein